MDFLLTGACGFIGSRVAEVLLDEGHGVLGVDNINDAYDRRLKDWRLERLNLRKGFDFHRLDASDRSDMASLFASAGNIDCVINLAARAGVRQSQEDPWSYMETNVTGALNLLEECRKHGIGKFIQASTSSLYGAHNAVPYSEDMDTNRTLSPYAASKKAAESLCYSYHHLYGLDVTVLRYFTVYGPAGRPDMSIFRFVQWIAEGRPVLVFGDGSQSRDFTYVDDIAVGTVRATGLRGYTTVNLGADRPVRLLDVIDAIERCIGKRAQIEFRSAHPADVPETWADITRARERLGWTPRIALEEGIFRVVSWYMDNRNWASRISTEAAVLADFRK